MADLISQKCLLLGKGSSKKPPFCIYSFPAVSSSEQSRHQRGVFWGGVFWPLQLPLTWVEHLSDP